MTAGPHPAGRWPRRPVPHDPRSGREDSHDPTAGIGGATPAHSALPLRLVLATFGLLTCGGAAIGLLATTTAPLLAVGLVVLAGLALVDLLVILERKRSGEPG